eukprot:scaffold2791_cov132-Skeletonema_marinoi.AAC.2
MKIFHVARESNPAVKKSRVTRDTDDIYLRSQRGVNRSASERDRATTAKIKRTFFDIGGCLPLLQTLST